MQGSVEESGHRAPWLLTTEAARVQRRGWAGSRAEEKGKAVWRPGVEVEVEGGAGEAGRKEKTTLLCLVDVSFLFQPTSHFPSEVPFPFF